MSMNVTASVNARTKIYTPASGPGEDRRTLDGARPVDTGGASVPPSDALKVAQRKFGPEARAAAEAARSADMALIRAKLHSSQATESTTLDRARDGAPGTRRPFALDGEPHDATPTSLMTERLGDGAANCIERATLEARPGQDEVLFMRDRTNEDGDDAGHALVRDRATGRVWDPNDGAAPEDPATWSYEDVDRWIRSQGEAPDRQPRYALDAAVDATTVRAVLSKDPGQRAGYIESLQNPELSKVAGRMYAAPDRPSDPSSPSTVATVQAYDAAGLPMYEVIQALPNMRLREVERAAQQGRQISWTSQPFGALRGAVGEAMVIRELRSTPSAHGIPQPVISNPVRAGRLPPWLGDVVGDNKPDVLSFEGYASPRMGPIRIGRDVDLRNAIGPGTDGRVQPRVPLERGRVHAILREVTTSTDFERVQRRADAVAAYARGISAINPSAMGGMGAEAVLVMDRGAYFRFRRENPVQMEAMVNRVTEAGGYIQLYDGLARASMTTAEDIYRTLGGPVR